MHDGWPPAHVARLRETPLEGDPSEGGLRYARRHNKSEASAMSADEDACEWPKLAADVPFLAAVMSDASMAKIMDGA